MCHFSSLELPYKTKLEADKENNELNADFLISPSLEKTRKGPKGNRNKAKSMYTNISTVCIDVQLMPKVTGCGVGSGCICKYKKRAMPMSEITMFNKLLKFFPFTTIHVSYQSTHTVCVSVCGEVWG